MEAGDNLGGQGVLVTRPAAQAAGLCRLIEAAGGRAIRFPAVEILPPADAARARRRLSERWDLWVFVSRNAVEMALPLMPEGRLPAEPELAAVGAATAQALAAAGRPADLVPEGRFDSESLLALLALSDLRGRRVLIVRGEAGRPVLGDTLTNRGAEVAYAEVYRRSLPKTDAASLLDRWERDVSLVVATSGEVLDNLLTLMGAAGRARLYATRLVVVSERTAERARKLGFSRVTVADHASDQALLAALCRAARS